MPYKDTIRASFAGGRAQEALAAFLRDQRWFGGKAQPMRSVEVIDFLPVDLPAAAAFFLLVRVAYHDGPDETYSVPLLHASDAAAIPAGGNGQPAPRLELREEYGGHAVFYDATASQPFLSSLLASIGEGRSFRGEHGELRMVHGSALDALAPSGAGPLPPRLMRVEQSNTSAVYGDRLVLKIFRRVEQGTNPDLEIGWFLTEKTSYRHVPSVAGYVDYRRDDGTGMSLGILQSFVANQGDAWKLTLAEVERYFGRVPAAQTPPQLPAGSLLALAEAPVPPESRELVGSFLDSAELLARRTAELHLALSTVTGDPAFDPEPYMPEDQRLFSSGAVELLLRNLRLLHQQLKELPAGVRADAQGVLDAAPALQRRFRSFAEHRLTALRTRIHGDYHLGQVLVSDRDFVIIDFEGEPARPMAERRRKRSPLQDVAGMLRSFHYAAYAPLLGAGSTSPARTFETFAPWAYLWQMCVSAAFLRAYFATIGPAPFISRDPRESATILEVHLLDKAVYELGYELNNRPSWVRIPLNGVAQLIAE